MRFLTTLALAASALCAALGSCTMGGTDTGHGSACEVVGTLYEPLGIRFAGGAAVAMRAAASLADTSGATSVDVASVISDANGQYVINGVDTGEYVVEAKDSANNRALIRPVHLARKDTATTLGPDTLKPAGAVKGKIILSEGGDPRKVLILSYGINRLARVNADGSFLFPDLAAGVYMLRLLPELADYDVLDTGGIVVSSADTADIGAILLHFSGIPTPKNLTISYDTLKQIVTISWNRADPALAASYNVYRRNIDSNTVFARVNSSPVTDTVYRDSAAAQDQTYEYSVVAVSGNAAEGTKSLAARVVVAGAYVLSDSIATRYNPVEITVDGSQNIYVTNGGIVSKFDGSLKSVYDFPVAADTSKISFAQTWGVAADNSNDVYVTSEKGVAKFSSAGNFLFTFAGSGAYAQIREVTVKDSIVYVSTDSAIVLYTLTGAFIGEWKTGPLLLPVSIACANRQVIAYCQPDQMLQFSSTGSLLDSRPAAGFLGLPSAVPMGLRGLESRNDTVFAVSGVRQKIYEFLADGTLICSASISSGLSSPNYSAYGLGIDAQGRLYVSSHVANRVYLFKKR